MSPTPPAKPRLHLEFLDGIRALAALFVVLHHAFLQVWPADNEAHLPTGMMRSWGIGLLFGHFAVTVFIVVSGFCLMLPVVRNGGMLRGGLGEFYKRRARRILPPYYAALALSLLLIWTLIGQKTGTHWDISIPVTPSGYAGNLLMLQNVVGKYQINHAFWSVAVEWQIYLLFPLFVLCWQKAGGKATTGIFLVLSYAVSLLLSRLHHLEGLTPHFLGMFALGAYGAQAAFGPRRDTGTSRDAVRWQWLAVLCALAGILLGARQDALTIYYHTRTYDIFVGMATMAMLIAASAPKPNALARTLSYKPLVSVGLFTYSIYLIHAPLLQVLWQYVLHPLRLSDNLTFLLLAGPGTILIIAVAYLFFRVCERPFLSTAAKSAVRQIESSASQDTSSAQKSVHVILER